MHRAYNTEYQQLEPLHQLIAEIQLPIGETASAVLQGFDIHAAHGSQLERQATSELGLWHGAKFLEDVHPSYENHTRLYDESQEPFSMPTKKEINDRISNWLKSKSVEEGWTAKEMAQELGISPQHLDALYQGRRGYGKKTIERIEKRFTTTYTAIAGLDKEIHEMRDIEALLEEWKGLALHYKKLYEDLQKRVESDPLLLGPPTKLGGR